jgi:molecular chaperone DnaK (HSP70)
MTKIIPKSTIIPIQKSRLFTTSQDNQSKIIINIYEGERVMAKR